MYAHFMIHTDVLSLLGTKENQVSEEISHFILNRLTDQFGEAAAGPAPFEVIGSDSELVEYKQFVADLKNGHDVQFQGILSLSPLPMQVQDFADEFTDSVYAQRVPLEEIAELDKAGIDKFYGREVESETAALATMLFVAGAGEGELEEIISNGVDHEGTMIYFTIIAFKKILLNSAAHAALNDDTDYSTATLH